MLKDASLKTESIFNFSPKIYENIEDWKRNCLFLLLGPVHNYPYPIFLVRWPN